MAFGDQGLRPWTPPGPAAPDPVTTHPLDPAKFRESGLTARGERRAWVALSGLRTLWFNTGSLCNIACGRCYIESSPTDDRLAFLTAAEVGGYLDEIARDGLPTREIGFTGGEPFVNRELPEMLRLCLARGFQVLVLTNALRPLTNRRTALLGLPAADRRRLVLRVSLDHYTAAVHDQERGPGTFALALEGLVWLARSGFPVHVAGRSFSGEDQASLRRGYARLFAVHDLAIDAADPAALVLFPEMDVRLDVPEITESCWGILGRSPESVMCASSRMVVKRRGAGHPTVVACTLLPYDTRFELGATLAEAAVSVPLNHPHCARFCVLGGGACSR